MIARHCFRAAGVILLGLSLTTSLEAQSQRNRALATREELQALLAPQAGKKGLSATDRQRIEARLTEGDFQQGDRLVVRVRGDTSLTDTFVIRADQTLLLPNIPPVSLKGVLRSEIQPTLLAVVSQYLRNPQVDADPLIRLGLLGAVTRPGYYSVRADVPLSELMVEAGGLSGEADVKKMTATRGEREIYSKEAIRQAMADGMSLDQLGLQGGDEITVGRRSGGFSGAIPIIGAVAATVLAIVGIASAI